MLRVSNSTTTFKLSIHGRFHHSLTITAQNNNTLLPYTMRADVLSQRIFTAGCFGLPWLWMVHALYYKGLENEPNNGETVSADSTNNQQGLLDADERKYQWWIWMDLLSTYHYWLMSDIPHALHASFCPKPNHTKHETSLTQILMNLPQPCHHNK